MTHVNSYPGWRNRVRALALLAVLVGACNGSDNLVNSNTPEAALDSVASDLASVDSATLDPAAIDSLAQDSLAIDSLSQLSPSALMAEASLYAGRGMAFGPDGLWASYTSLKTRSLPFSGSINYTDARGIIQQINAARNMGQRLVLTMTGGSHARYKSGGRFDLSKWKAVMNTYNRRDIKAAVAKGVSDGTIIMNSVMDEPNVPDWGGVLNKSVLDGMARYVKAIFPTLPVGVQLRYDWKQSERFRVMDAYITAYSYHKGEINTWKSKVLANARNQGMKVMFDLNVLDGGINNWQTKACPIPLTGGRGTYFPMCRMTASQVRSWGRNIGPAGCGGLLMWRYDLAFMSKSANITAFRDVAATLRGIPSRACRRA
jgi:hypothetical protein